MILKDPFKTKPDPFLGEVLFRNRAMATIARGTWGDFGKARVVGFPPARQMEMEALHSGLCTVWDPPVVSWFINPQ